MKQRTKRHFTLSSRLALMSDDDIVSLISKERTLRGWGSTQVLQLDDHPVFVKCLPLTDLESRHAYSTRNHYRLPLFYNYGVGSAGMGAFRELATHVKTTNWVLNGETRQFPLLHHHRIVGNPAPGSFAQDEEQLKSYLSFWNNSKAVEKYLRARGDAANQLVLFIEHVPFEFVNWSLTNPGRVEGMAKKALEAVRFLHSKDVIHFDAHVQNWLTDGKTVYLSDFGLALDKAFDLTEKETAFFNDHRLYDLAQVIHSVGDGVIAAFFQAGEARQAKIIQLLDAAPDDFRGFSHELSTRALELHSRKLLTLPAFLHRHFERYGDIIQAKGQFFAELSGNKRKNTPYPAAKLRRMLKRAGAV